jgi:hypothetical protein
MRLSSTAAERKSTSSHRAIYDGREKLGSVEQLGREFIAHDRRGQVIGHFDTAIEAINAVGENVAKVAP